MLNKDFMKLHPIIAKGLEVPQRIRSTTCMEILMTIKEEAKHEIW